jgi:hypothetical protein
MADTLKILDPYHGLEAITIPAAESLTGIPARTLRRWCVKYRIGRRVGGYKRPWMLSKVALAIVLARDWGALAAYHRGMRTEEPVANYYRAAGLEGILREFAALEESTSKKLAATTAIAATSPSIAVTP